MLNVLPIALPLFAPLKFQSAGCADFWSKTILGFSDAGHVSQYREKTIVAPFLATLVRPEGIEPPTDRVETCCSIR